MAGRVLEAEGRRPVSVRKPPPSRAHRLALPPDAQRAHLGAASPATLTLPLGGRYAKGPLVAYALPVARALVPRLLADEPLALNRSQRTLRDKVGNLQPPDARNHPSRAILYDDVYYSALVFELFGGRDLTLVDAPFSEYVKERPWRVQPGALIFHKLKHPRRFEWVRNNSAGLVAGRTWQANRSLGRRPPWLARPLALDFRAARTAERWSRCAPCRSLELPQEAQVRGWQFVRYSERAWKHWRDIPPGAYNWKRRCKHRRSEAVCGGKGARVSVST